MPTLIDPRSKLTITSFSDFSRALASAPSHEDVRTALSSMILSASGWRKVFAASGQEEDQQALVLAPDLVLSALMAQSYFEFLAEKTQLPPRDLVVVLGTDTRPTGRLLADAMIRMAVALGVQVRYAFVTSAPEHLAWAQMSPDVHGFVYISASHNPIGHNGVKFGFREGGVLGGNDSRDLIAAFRRLVDNPAVVSLAWERISVINADRVRAVYSPVEIHKKAALEAYARFTRRVMADSSDRAAQDESYRDLAEGLQRRPLGILADLNGSARTLTIDQDFLASLGIKVRVINGEAGQIAHRIVPEGRSLDPCREALAALRREDPDFVLGYVPDNDGDRGNVVYHHAPTDTVRAIEAQEVFALAVLAELADQRRRLPPGQKLAVAVNDPTSCRLEEIAEAFDARVFRAEVGEANVVNLANRLRQEGWVVRILGEGSNGGNITYPSNVRDPLNTLIGLAKLLTVKDDARGPGLFHRYCLNRGLAYHDDFTLADILEALPPWTTTSAYEDRAIMPIRSTDHARLKEAYEAIFPGEFQKQASLLKERHGIVAWTEYNYEGTEEKAGVGKAFRSGQERGGFKILFQDEGGRARAFIWMRGSGTEPVFRVLADVAGRDEAAEAWFLQWHCDMIRQADVKASPT